MGRDKALLPLHGIPLAQSIAIAVARGAGSATLVGDPGRYSSLGLRVIPDLFPGDGPLGGIVTALRDSTAEWNVIAACDMPHLDGRLFLHLLRAARETDADVLLPVVNEGGSGRPQPLCAVYRRSCLAPIEAAFAHGVRKVTAALASLRTVRRPVEMEQIPQFQNLNTPEDWAAYDAG
jgi:molybdopterin-guanine dinucleotide biosynthesis protein A